jgi:NAD(P)H-nitrite reductase large subunit
MGISFQIQEIYQDRINEAATRARRLVILGNGGASMNAVQGARATGYAGSIQVISDTTGPAFNPMLSPYYLDGKIPFDCCFPYGMDWYNTHDVTCHFGAGVEELDPVEREISLSTGENISYDECLIATGARPVLPDLPGLKDSRNIHTLRTADDTLRLHEAASAGKKAVILGASLIGIKLAEILIRRGIGVTLLDITDQILTNTAHSQCAEFITKRIEEGGADIFLGWVLDRVEDNGKQVHLHFSNDRSLYADLCIMGVGVRPNLNFIGNSKVEIDRGIIIDGRMRTSAEHLYAAGDVSQGMNILSGKKEIIGLWGNACYQGRTAGINMAGGGAVYHGTIPSHISTFFGLYFAHLGDVNRQGKDVLILSRKGDSNDMAYQLFIFDKGVLVGANMVNSLQHAGRLKSAIVRRLDWTRYLNRLSRKPNERELGQVLSALNV